MSAITRRQTREEIGLVEPNDRRTDTSREGVTIHWPGINWEGIDWSGRSHDVCEEKWRQWQEIHMGRGSNDLEYGSGLCFHRVWMEGRLEFDRWDVRVGSNGTRDANYTHGSLCILIGPDDPLTDDLLRAAGEIIGEMRSHGWGEDLKGHRDFVQTTCPGDRLYAALPTIDRYAKESPVDLSPETIEELVTKVAKRVNMVGGDWNAEGEPHDPTPKDGDADSNPERLDQRVREIEKVVRRTEEKVDSVIEALASLPGLVATPQTTAEEVASILEAVQELDNLVLVRQGKDQ